MCFTKINAFQYRLFHVVHQEFFPQYNNLLKFTGENPDFSGLRYTCRDDDLNDERQFISSENIRSNNLSI